MCTIHAYVTYPHVHTGWALCEVPDWLGEFVHLEALRLDGRRGVGFFGTANANLSRLPASLGDLAVLKHLTLMNFKALQSLPVSIGRLASLETLHVEGCASLQELPASIGQLTALRKVSLYKLQNLKELPMTFGALTNLDQLSVEKCALTGLPASFAYLGRLKTLLLRNLKAFDALPASIGRLTSLQTLHVDACALTHGPSSIESLAALQWLWLDVSTSVQLDSRVFTELACSLPTLRRLGYLVLKGLGEDDLQAIGRTLKAWPLSRLWFDEYRQIGLKSCWQALALPPEAVNWDDMIILQVSQHTAAQCNTLQHSILQ